MWITTSGRLSSQGFFQKSYLPGMIEIVLDHAVQQDVERISGSWRELFELWVVNLLDAFA